MILGLSANRHIRIDCKNLKVFIIPDQLTTEESKKLLFWGE